MGKKRGERSPDPPSPKVRPLDLMPAAARAPWQAAVVRFHQLCFAVSFALIGADKNGFVRRLYASHMVSPIGV